MFGGRKLPRKYFGVLLIGTYLALTIGGWYKIQFLEVCNFLISIVLSQHDMKKLQFV